MVQGNLLLLWHFMLFFLFFSQYSIECDVGVDITTSSSSSVRKFTSYALEFHSYQQELEESSCPLEMIGNITEIIFSTAVDRCASVRYYPRNLHPKQVSWRRTRGHGNGHGQHGQSSNGRYWNSATISNAQNEDHQKKKYHESHEIVSEFLAFALLLPGHPFSDDLYFSIVTVAPMYPRVIFVIGNAHEFTELCAQYGVRSFPKLLFFQKVHKMILMD